MKTKFTRLAAAALALSTVISSCSKTDDAPPTPIDPVVSVYFPTVITYDGIPLDSFVYNADYTVSKFFAGDEESKKFTSTYEFMYDNDKVCRKVKRTETHGVAVDTLIYQTNKIMRVRLNPNAAKPDTVIISLNANKQVLLVGTKDTLPTATPGSRILSYLEFTYNNGNIATFTNKDASFYQNENGSGSSVFTISANYTYDDKVNTLKPFFVANPAMYYYFYEGAAVTFSCGNNNITKMEATIASGGTAMPLTYNFTATFDETNGTLKEQKRNDGEGVTTIGYKWVKAN
ncbi:hypothetical protein [Chitinophaga sp. sic0106]|uniref:hypothetical protein n=1 Tax=Chitinophaga sp. sic0106 TaxID=2854785 RepID=UPI001C45F8E3|nr:hypothetical protein [Chitinophaga sp. sic0106]MBV7532828.1 hypothetical protein [Chitinophaga sp. sic0106]